MASRHNLVTLTAKVTDDPIVRPGEQGVICHFHALTVPETRGCVDRAWTPTRFILVEVCGRLAVLCGRCLSTESVVRLEGHLGLNGFVEQNSESPSHTPYMWANDVLVLVWGADSRATARDLFSLDDLPF